MLDMKTLPLYPNPFARFLRAAAAPPLLCFLLIGHSAYADSSQPIGTNNTPVAPQNCGAVALAQLAHTLHSGTNLEEKFLNTPAPQGGFSLADLRGLAAANGIKLEAVRAPSGAEWPVPCIVHWKIGHYGVILERKGSNYRIVSKPSGRGIWVDSRAMQVYASGAVLAPEDSVERSWRPLSQTEAETLRGTIACWGYSTTADTAVACHLTMRTHLRIAVTTAKIRMPTAIRPQPMMAPVTAETTRRRQAAVATWGCRGGM
jgi:hypothetical protein